VVAVRIENERSVVGRMIFLANPGLNVVAPTCGDCGLVEGIDGRAIGRRKCDVRCTAFLTSADPKIRLVGAEPGRSRKYHQTLVTERGERPLKEILAPVEIGYRKAYMVQHGGPPFRVIAAINPELDDQINNQLIGGLPRHEYKWAPLIDMQ